MVTVNDIYNLIDKVAPFDRSLSYDNVGLLIGNKAAEVKRIIVTLDITRDVVFEAIAQNCELIVSHHPVIFNPLKKINSDSVVHLLVKNNINVISAHTNLDLADKIGVNATLAKKLSLNGIKYLSYEDGLPIALYGSLERTLNADEFATYVKKSLGCKFVKYYASNKEIHTVGFCCGGGSEFIKDAIKQGLDAYVSGDIKHHEFVLAKDSGVTLVDAGHFATEDIAMQPLAEFIKTSFPELRIEKSTANDDLNRYLF